MPVSNQSAPFKKSPEFSRGSFLRSPDWRWQQARIIAMADQREKVCSAQTDPLILYAARLQKACRVPATRDFIRIKFPDAWQIMTLGCMDNSSQMKASLQACIIYGLDAERISQKLKWLTPVQAQMYIDLFCDLSGVQGIAEWFQQMLLEPARQGRSMNLFRARALAHYHSLEAALHSLRFGNSGKSAKEAMEAMWRDARNKQLFDYMAQNLNVPIQIYVQSMQQAIKGRQDKAFILETKQESSEGQQGLVEAISADLDASIRTYTQAQISSAEGEDPANAIINKITHKQEKA